jgi:hypothetical protein
VPAATLTAEAALRFNQRKVVIPSERSDDSS